MRLLLSLLVTLIASTSAAQAQSMLPGPAQNGWYVLMMRKVNVHEQPYCLAQIVTADDLSAYTGKHYGPFNSRFEAHAALSRSGWTYIMTGYITDNGDLSGC